MKGVYYKTRGKSVILAKRERKGKGTRQEKEE